MSVSTWIQLLMAVIAFLGLAGTMIACTWKVLERLTRVEDKMDGHAEMDEMQFREIRLVTDDHEVRIRNIESGNIQHIVFHKPHGVPPAKEKE